MHRFFCSRDKLRDAVCQIFGRIKMLTGFTTASSSQNGQQIFNRATTAIAQRPCPKVPSCTYQRIKSLQLLTSRPDFDHLPSTRADSVRLHAVTIAQQALENVLAVRTPVAGQQGQNMELVAAEDHIRYRHEHQLPIRAARTTHRHS